MLTAATRFRPRVPDSPGVIASAVFTALLVGAMASIGLWYIGLGLIVVIAFTLYALAEPERCALGLLVVLPFLVAPFKLGEFALFAGMPAALLIGISLLLRTWGSGQWRAPHLLGGVFALLLIVMAVSTFYSNDVLRGVSRMANVLMFAAFAAGVGTALASGRIKHRHVALAFVAGAGFAGIALTGQSLAQFVVGEGRVTDFLRDVQPVFQGRSGGGQNWHANGVDMLRALFPFMVVPSAGQYMAMGIIAATWLLLDPRRPRAGATNPLVVAALGIMAIALALTFSRQAWVGAVIGILALLARAKRGNIVIAAVPLLIIATILPVPGAGQSLGGYLWEAKSTKSGEDRIQLWEQALDIAATNVATGIGPGQYQDLGTDPNRAFYSHNLWLDQLVELGYFGGFLFATFALALLALAWTRGNALSFGLLTTYIIANVFDDVFYFPRNGLALAMAIALIAVAPPRVPKTVAPARPAEEPAREPERVPALSGA